MLTEQELDFLKQQIPILAETAMRQANWQTLTLGNMRWFKKTAHFFA